jgi:hypothetical protein
MHLIELLCKLIKKEKEINIAMNKENITVAMVDC